MAKNPLFGTLNNGNSSAGFPNGMMEQFQKFAQAFTGDPQQKVQELLNSGKMSQSDFNRYSQMANQLAPMFGGNSQ